MATLEIEITAKHLQAIMQCNASRAELFAPHIHRACQLFEINTPARMAAFLAQIGHESGRLVYTREIWGPTPAQQKYEGRKDLGNTQAGDGKRYLGRGLIQTTGRANYRATHDGLSDALEGVPDFEQTPTALELPEWAALSAAWYWHSRGLNALADTGAFDAITRKINGGNNGAADRRALWVAAKRFMEGTKP